VKEIRNIIIAFDKASSKGLQSALATVVHVEGSSYRKPGARMLITEEGELTGAISGGCLEGDALRKALLVMKEKKARLVTYDTMDEDDAKFGVGLGCNGIIQVLIEPIDQADPLNPVALLKAVNEKRQKSVLVTLFNLENKKAIQYGTCFLLTEEQGIKSREKNITEQLIPDAQSALAVQQSFLKNYRFAEQEFSAFIELVHPPVSLVITGGGNDVIPVVQMADIMGWETTVADGRPGYATPERFAAACRLMVIKPDALLEKIRIDERTFFLLMTHNYNADLAMLRHLLLKKVTYIGMLGPRKKKERMLKELKEEGLEFSDQQLEVLHSPVGLAIGSETPEDIALAIIAEIRSLLNSYPAVALLKQDHPGTGDFLTDRAKAGN